MRHTTVSCADRWLPTRRASMCSTSTTATRTSRTRRCIIILPARLRLRRPPGAMALSNARPRWAHRAGEANAIRLTLRRRYCGVGGRGHGCCPRHRPSSVTDALITAGRREATSTADRSTPGPWSVASLRRDRRWRERCMAAYRSLLSALLVVMRPLSMPAHVAAGEV